MTTPTFPATTLDHVAETVRIPAGHHIHLIGTLALPPQPTGLVVFAHGSGSSRLSPRNRFVADRLFDANLGWLLFDLLTEAEAEVRRNVFDIPLLADRLRHATSWAHAQPATADLPLGYFGASTGAAAALVAAAHEPRIAAIVSRGGRPDLAGDFLKHVHAPTLLIVGGADEVVYDLNERALAELTGEKSLVVIPGATHLFEEPGALEAVAEHATAWFTRHLIAGDTTVPTRQAV
ncbi:MAG TPA: dienelactone hydrolase family protein [Gemmatimonadales bacterium]|nr:dienelactone hydrolase family protein [Gemmatimonadales bacterium]